MRTIKVTGRGRLSVKPDTIDLLLTVEDVKKKYADALRASEKETGKLKDLFCSLGFQEEDLKTEHFSIDARYEGYSDKNGNWKQRFVGFAFTHNMKLSFPAEGDMLGKILGALSTGESNAQFSIRYTVKDIEACRNRLLKNAVSDAREKAEVIAGAAGVKLLNIAGIDYSFGSIEVYSEPMNFRALKCESVCEDNAAFGMNMTADDISVDDSVTVIWEIE